MFVFADDLVEKGIASISIRVPFQQQIQLKDIKPGMYVVKVVSGKEVVSGIVKIE